MDREDEILINEIINKRDNQKFMQELIKSYCKLSVDNCRQLLELIPEISKTEIAFYYDKMLSYCKAANWLIVQEYMNKKFRDTYFASMVPVVQILYPEGLREGESEARIKYFDEFINLLKDTKVFSFDNPEDVSWATQFGFIDYLKDMYDKYVIKR